MSESTTKQQLFAQLHEECLQCQKCPLWETRTNVVFGVGNPDSPILIIGEGPGEQEDLEGEPVVGAAGKLLDDMLQLIGLDRSKRYIANIVKCRPPRNRDPLKEEQEACMPWLEQQMERMQPQVILCLGRVAAQRMIRPDFKITQDHGKWYRQGNTRLMAIYHPSALLRDESKRPETFADLREFRKYVREQYPHLYSEVFP